MKLSYNWTAPIFFSLQLHYTLNEKGHTFTILYGVKFITQNPIHVKFVICSMSVNRIVSPLCPIYIYIYIYINIFCPKKVTCDSWNVTAETWQLKVDMWHVTCEMWHISGGEHCLKMSGLYLVLFGNEGVLKTFSRRITQSLDWIINYWIRKVLVEQPRTHWTC